MDGGCRRGRGRAAVVYVGATAASLGSLISNGIELAAVGLAWWGSRRQPPHRRAATSFLAVGLAAFFLADITWWAQAHVGFGPDVAPSDALYLCSYAALGTGLWRLAGTRERTRADLLAGWIDARRRLPRRG